MAETLKDRMAKRREAGNPYSNAIFAAQNRGKVAEYNQQVSEEGQQAQVTAVGPGMVILFKPGPYGYDRVPVPVTNLDVVLPAGYLPECPTCGTATCQEDGKPCSGLPPSPYRVCPIPSCRKRFYDRPPVNEVQVEEDENMIRDDAYVPSTPELRTKAALDAHMQAYHPSETAAMARQNPTHLKRIEEVK